MSSWSRSATRPVTACTCAAATTGALPSVHAPRRSTRPRGEGSGAATLPRELRPGAESGFSRLITEARAVQDHRQLLSRRGSVQPGRGRRPEHLRHFRTDGGWASTFTQEWPAPSKKNQLSYTIAYVNGDVDSGFGDTLINYRYQASEEGPGCVAFSPRVSVVLPTGNRDRSLGDGTVGLQFNLPVSKQLNDWDVHWNGGLTWLPRAQGELEGSATRRRERRENSSRRFLRGARSTGSCRC